MKQIRTADLNVLIASPCSMQNRYKCSIVIATQNPNLDRLSQVLDSFAIQTEKDFEVILVDDGSDMPVASDVVRRKYPFDLQIMRIDTPSGQGYALNKGILKARSDIIIRADDDDIFSNAVLQEHLSNLSEPGTVSSVSLAYEFNNRLLKQTTQNTRSSAIESLAKLKFPVGHCAIAFRKSEFLEVGGYDAPGVGQDFSLFIRLFKKFKLVRSSNAYVSYLVKTNGHSSRSIESRRAAYQHGYRFLSQKKIAYSLILNHRLLFNVYMWIWKIKRNMLILKIRMCGDLK